MNRQDLLIGFVSGIVATSVIFLAARRSPTDLSLHVVEVRSLDAETQVPIPANLKYPDNTDFTTSTGKTDKPFLVRTEHAGENGRTRITWIGTQSPDAYEFTLTASGYEDLIIPTDLIETTTSLTAMRTQESAVLHMRRAEQDAGHQDLTHPESKLP